jgi:hypothetical protein
MARADPYSSDARNVLSSSSTLQTQSTGFYASGLPFGSIPSPSLQQIHAELPLPGGRRAARTTHGFQVQLTGNVNVVDDLSPAPTPEQPSHQADVGGTSGSNSAPAETSTTVAAGTVMAGSSWHYGLQQLRMKNERLRAELAAVKKDGRMKQKEENARRATFESHGSTSSSRGVVDHARPVSMPMAWGGGFATPTSVGGSMAGPSRSVTFPTTLSMPPPPAPHHPQPQPSSSSHPHGYETQNDNHKRTWSQTDMNPDWNQWGH